LLVKLAISLEISLIMYYNLYMNEIINFFNYQLKVRCPPMAKLTKQFFDLIDPTTKEKKSGQVIKLELETGTKKFIDFHNFINQIKDPQKILENNMKKGQTINMKIANKKAEKLLEDYYDNNSFTEI